MNRYAVATTPFINLRINDEGKEWEVFDLMNTRRWRRCPTNRDIMFAAPSAVIHMTDKNQRARISLHTDVAHRILFASTITNVILGWMDIASGGQITMREGMGQRIPHAPTDQWAAPVTIILGTTDVFTVNVTEVTTGDEDMFRHKAGEQKLYLPKKYWPRSYDSNKTSDTPTAATSERQRMVNVASNSADMQVTVTQASDNHDTCDLASNFGSMMSLNAPIRNQLQQSVPSMMPLELPPPLAMPALVPSEAEQSIETADEEEP